MRKILVIVYLMFLSCDSSELFGVHELDNTTLDYYDYIARGWQAIFDEDFDLAVSDFNEATLLDSIDNKNSAYVGLGWTSTFSANAFFNSSECIGSTEIECVDVINNLRLNAKDYFKLATESCLDTLGVTLNGWNNTEAGCSQEGYTYSNIDSARAEYFDDNIDNGGIYINTFEEFYIDLEIGNLYLDLLEFDINGFDLEIEANSLQLEEIIGGFEQFLNDNPDYDISSDKPLYETTFNFNANNIATLLAQLLLRVGEDCKAEYYLQINDICEDYSLGSDRLYSFTSLTENDEIEADCGTLTEIKFNTGYYRTLTDFMFYDSNDNLINIDYYDNGDNPDHEIKDGCNLPEYTVSYANSNPDYIIYNIPENIKEFKLKFDTYLSEGEEFSGYDPDFEYIHGCYNPSTNDDNCLCDDVDEWLILDCIETVLSE